MSPAQIPFSVLVHPFPSTTPSSCAYERGAPSSRNALLYIGGLTTGPHSTPQLEPLIFSLESSELSYSVWEFRMRSSYTGFGYSSLANDAEDLAALVEYVKALGKERIVVVGSSTGCQAIMTYVSTRKFPKLSGYVLQAPTSDRETAGLLMPPEFIQESLGHAKEMISKDQSTHIMPAHLIPPIFHSPITAYRWHSLLAPGGDDDFFSSDISDTTLSMTFGRLNAPTLILPSENDEMVPSTVDKRGLLWRWKKAAKEGIVSELSGVIEGADHGLSDENMQTDFGKKIVEFLRSL